MSLHDRLNIWVNEYPRARHENLAQHSLADLIRRVIPSDLRVIVGPQYVVKGGPGAGNWAYVPWIAIMNPRITTSVQNGYFVIYSLRSDGSGLYLSINHGVTEVTQRVGEYNAVNELTRLANQKRLLIQNELGSFSTGPLDYCAPLPKANLPQYGAVCHKLYNRGNIPNEDSLITDLNQIMMLCNKLILKER